MFILLNIFKNNAQHKRMCVRKCATTFLHYRYETNKVIFDFHIALKQGRRLKKYNYFQQ